MITDTVLDYHSELELSKHYLDKRIEDIKKDNDLYHLSFDIKTNKFGIMIKGSEWLSIPNNDIKVLHKVFGELIGE